MQDEATPDETEPRESGDIREAKQKRVRLAAPRKQLERTIQQMTKASETAMRPEKLVDLLLGLSELQSRLLDIDREDRPLKSENAALSAQHEANLKRIAELEAENAGLKNHRCQATVIREQDPEAAQLRETNAALTSLLQGVTKEYSNESERAQAAIRAIQSSTPVLAKVFCESIRVDHASYHQMMQRYKTDAELLDVVSKAQQRGPLVIFCEAMLAVRDAEIAGMKFASVLPAKRDLQAENAEALRCAAAEMGNKPRPVPMPVMSAEENLKNQVFSFAGSPLAEYGRERVTPVYVQPETRPEGISGCALGSEF